MATGALAEDGTRPHGRAETGAAGVAVGIEEVSKTFEQPSGAPLLVLDRVSFGADRGRITAILGPSGCGKSTLLHIVAGLTRPDAGEVTLFGGPAENLRAERKLSYVFQEDRLLPWRTALRNVMLGLEAAGVPGAERRERAHRALELMRLDGFAEAFPHQLSGGMRSRVALARSLVLDPLVLLMDEPFGRLDALTRAAMHEELLRIWERLETSILFVTHDVEEAVVLADRVVVLAPRPGRLRAVVEVDNERPRVGKTPAIADLIHELRMMLGSVEDETARTEGT